MTNPAKKMYDGSSVNILVKINSTWVTTDHCTDHPPDPEVWSNETFHEESRLLFLHIRVTFSFSYVDMLDHNFCYRCKEIVSPRAGSLWQVDEGYAPYRIFHYLY